MGKAIYKPKGKAAEYGKYACNFHVGCSNGCTYCYCKKGILSKSMGGDVPVLKKCFKDEGHALKIFEKELLQNKEELQKHGLFFSFTSDPMLPETIDITMKAIEAATDNYVPVKILTKCTCWVDAYLRYCEIFEDAIGGGQEWRKNYAFGFTLTGHDELEPNASPNSERIEAMKKLHAASFKTWTSIEPIIDFESSKDMIRKTAGYCDLYKIGLESGKNYDNNSLLKFIEYCNSAYMNGKGGFYYQKNYFKDSLLKQAGINREKLPDNCVDRDYNIFKNEKTY